MSDWIVFVGITSVFILALCAVASVLDFVEARRERRAAIRAQHPAGKHRNESGSAA